LIGEEACDFDFELLNSTAARAMWFPIRIAFGIFRHLGEIGGVAASLLQAVAMTLPRRSPSGALKHPLLHSVTVVLKKKKKET
jgi:hypothetical protein